MAPDTLTMPRQATPAAWPELSTTEQPATAVTSVLVAPTAAESESAAPPNPAAAARPGPAREPHCRAVGTHPGRHLRVAVLLAGIRPPAWLGGLPFLCLLAQLAHRPRPRRRAREAARRRRAGRSQPPLRGHGLRAAFLLHRTGPYAGGHPRHRGAAGRRRLRRHRRAGGAAGAGVAAGGLRRAAGLQSRCAWRAAR